MEGSVTITKYEYFELRCNSEELSRLNAAGVDNWDGCGDAMDGFDDWEEQERERIKAL